MAVMEGRDEAAATAAEEREVDVALGRRRERGGIGTKGVVHG